MIRYERYVYQYQQSFGTQHVANWVLFQMRFRVEDWTVLRLLGVFLDLLGDLHHVLGREDRWVQAMVPCGIQAAHEVFHDFGGVILNAIQIVDQPVFDDFCLFRGNPIFHRFPHFTDVVHGLAHLMVNSLDLSSEISDLV